MKQKKKISNQTEGWIPGKSKPTPEQVKHDTRQWKDALKRILREHNWKHATKDKGVSARTQELRRDTLFKIFRTLRSARFKIAPYNLGGRHIEFIMRYDTATAGMANELKILGSKLEPRDAPLAAATIQSNLSTLRTYCEWINKPGMVRSAEYYADKYLVERTGNATRDRTWSGADVDRAAVVAKVTQADPVVGLQLEVMMAFGLRRKEAVMFCPTLACVPNHGLPDGETSTSYLAFLKVKRGTKGGRLRYVALRNETQEEVYLRALKAAPHPGSHIGYSGKTLKQALDKFSNVLRACGVTMDQLGVTPHGLRHEFASDLYFDLTEVQPPVKGGDPHLSREAMDAAYLEVARQLGHNRPQISHAYLGSRAAARPSH
nr:integrase domain-containing protein [Massilia sp. JS1662]